MADYQIPPWLTASGNMGEEYAQTYQNSRRLDMEKDRQKFQQGIESTDEAMREQQFNQQNEAQAAMLADRAAYQQDIASGVDPKLAILKHPGVFGSRGIPASLLNAPKPPPAPQGFQPLIPPTSPAITSVAATPSAGTPAPAAPETSSQWLQAPGFVTGPDGKTHFDRGTPAPRPATPPRPFALNPGQIGYDAVTHQPFATNSLPRLDSKVLKPGDELFESGKPVGTNSTPRLTSKQIQVMGASSTNAIPIGKMTQDDLQDGKFYKLPAGVLQWDEETKKFIFPEEPAAK